MQLVGQIVAHLRFRFTALLFLRIACFTDILCEMKETSFHRGILGNTSCKRFILQLITKLWTSNDANKINMLSGGLH